MHLKMINFLTKSFLQKKIGFLTKISIFDQNCDFGLKFRFLIKISIFDQNFDFWPKFRLLTKISIFDQNFDFWPKRFFDIPTTLDLVDNFFVQNVPVVNFLFSVGCGVLASDSSFSIRSWRTSPAFISSYEKIHKQKFRKKNHKKFSNKKNISKKFHKKNFIKNFLKEFHKKIFSKRMS